MGQGKLARVVGIAAAASPVRRWRYAGGKRTAGDDNARAFRKFRDSAPSFIIFGFFVTMIVPPGNIASLENPGHRCSIAETIKEILDSVMKA
jgi:hypothetical protein